MIALLRFFRQLVARENRREIARFAVTGGANTVLAYGLFSLLVSVGIAYYFSLAFDYLFAVVFSLIVNRLLVFRDGRPIGVSTFTRMAFSYVAMFLVNEAILAALVNWLGVGPFAGQALASAVIGAMSFLLQKRIVFGIRATPAVRRT